MPWKYLLVKLVIICLTLLSALCITSERLCELHIDQGSNKYAVFLDCKVKR